jgi:hypothetical protein
MTSFLYLTRTIHMPVEARGSKLLNSFGVEIAIAADPVTAAAMADLINLGREPAAAREHEHEAAEDKRSGWLKNAPRNC